MILLMRVACLGDKVRGGGGDMKLETREVKDGGEQWRGWGG